MKNSFFFFLFYLCFSSACTHQGKYIKDKINLDIPDSSDLAYKFHNARVNELNLPNLELGIDSFELRLWKYYEPYNINEIIVIRKDSKKKWWEGYYYRYWDIDIISELEVQRGNKFFEDEISKNSPEVYTLIDSLNIKKENPKSGWDIFLNEIKKEKIYELPNQKKIPNYKHSTFDGLIWEIEIGTSDSYKYYSYENPQVYAEKFWQCKQMIKIAEIFEREFPLRPPIDIEALIEKNKEKKDK